MSISHDDNDYTTGTSADGSDQAGFDVVGGHVGDVFHV